MSDTLTEAVVDQIDTLPPGEAPPEPVDIELPAEETPEPQGQPAETPAPAPAAQPQKSRGRPTNERIADLVGQKNTLMQELEQERQRSATLQQTLKDKDAELSAGQTRQMELHKARLQSETERARQDYESAIREQDSKKQTDAAARLARSESGLADVEAWEARNKPAPAAQPQSQQQPQPQPQAQAQPQQQRPQLDPTTQAWMSDNPWFMPNHAEFNRSMHLAAVAYASRIEDRLTNEGRENEIAGPEYWNEVNAYMAKEFPDRFEADPAAQPQPAQQPRQGSPVAGAQRSQPASPGQRQPAQNGKVLAQLTGPERATADSLRNSGALLYPANHPKVQANPQLRGQRMSAEDSYIAYGVQVRRDKADQAVRRANQ